MNRNAVLCSVVCALVSTGCAAQSVNDSESSNSTLSRPDLQLTLEKASTVDGLEGSFGSDSEALHFETARMPLQAGEGREDGRDFDLALRIMDSTGHTLVLVKEGYRVPETWNIPSNEERQPRPIPSSAYTMAGAAADALEMHQFDRQLSPETAQLIYLLRFFAQQNIRPRVVPELEALMNYSHIVSYTKPAFFQGSPFDHTATLTQIGSCSTADHLCTPDREIYSCNHGSCPFEPQMEFYTENWSPFTSIYPPAPQMCVGQYGIPHVCNNDTLLQQHNVVDLRTWEIPDLQTGFCDPRLWQKPYTAGGPR